MNQSADKQPQDTRELPPFVPPWVPLFSFELPLLRRSRSLKSCLPGFLTQALYPGSLSQERPEQTE